MRKKLVDMTVITFTYQGGRWHTLTFRANVVACLWFGCLSTNSSMTWCECGRWYRTKCLVCRTHTKQVSWLFACVYDAACLVIYTKQSPWITGAIGITKDAPRGGWTIKYSLWVTRRYIGLSKQAWLTVWFVCFKESTWLHIRAITIRRITETAQGTITNNSKQSSSGSCRRQGNCLMWSATFLDFFLLKQNKSNYSFV